MEKQSEAGNVRSEDISEINEDEIIFADETMNGDEKTIIEVMDEKGKWLDTTSLYKRSIGPVIQNIIL